MKTDVQDPTTIPGFRKMVMPAQPEGLTYQGKHYRGCDWSRSIATVNSREDLNRIWDLRLGEPFECSQAEARFLVSQVKNGKPLATLHRGGWLEVVPHGDGFHQYSSWHYSRLAEDVPVRCVMLGTMEIDPETVLPRGTRMRRFLNELGHWGASWRYCSREELATFLKTGEVGPDGLDPSHPWPGRIAFKIMEPNPKRTKTAEDRRFAESILAGALSAMRGEQGRDLSREAASSGWKVAEQPGRLSGSGYLK